MNFCSDNYLTLVCEEECRVRGERLQGTVVLSRIVDVVRDWDSLSVKNMRYMITVREK